MENPVNIMVENPPNDKNIAEMDTESLENLKVWYFNRHKEAMDAYRSDNVDKWDEKAQEYMEKLREIDKELRSRQTP